MTALPEYYVMQLHRIAQLLTKDNQHENAANLYKTLVDLHPNDPNYNFGLGYSLSQQKKYNEALPPLARAARISEDHPAYRYHLGQCFTELGRHEDAEPHFRDAVQLKEQDATYQQALGACLLAQEQTEACQPHLKKAAELFEQIYDVENKCKSKLLIGIAQSSSGNSADAIETLREVFTIANNAGNQEMENLSKHYLNNFVSPDHYFWSASRKLDI